MVKFVINDLEFTDMENLMKRTMLLVVAMIWSISAFAVMPPFDHKIKIDPTDAWATVTNQTANYDDESKFGLTESSNTWSINVADNNDVLPASVVWNDRVGVQHIVILRDRAATFTIIVPARGNVSFIGADGGGERRDVNVGINSWQKIQFSINATGGILIEGVSLEGSSFVNQATWKEALAKASTGVDLYTAIGKKPINTPEPFDHKVKFNPAGAWATVTKQTANYDDESKFGLTESSNTWSVHVPDALNNFPASVSWIDNFSVEHIVILRDMAASFTIIVPLYESVLFVGGDGGRERVWASVGKKSFQKIKFSIKATGGILIEGISLNRNSFVNQSKWKEALKKVASGVDLYTALGRNLSTNPYRFDHQIYNKSQEYWVPVTYKTANYDDESKFGLTEGSNTWSVHVPCSLNTVLASVDWFDLFGVLHRVEFSEKDESFTIIVPASGNLTFLGCRRLQMIREVNVGLSSFQKIKFSINPTGGMLIEGVSLEGTSFVDNFTWNNAIYRVTTSEADLYMAIGRGKR